jgi:hypothetical protein
MGKRAWKKAMRRLKARIECLENAFQAEAAECLQRDLELAEAIEGVPVRLRGPNRSAN